MGRRIYLVLSLLLFSWAALSQPIILKEDAGRVDVKGRLSHWRDAKGTLTLEEAQQLIFFPLKPNEAPNFGFDKAAHWFKLDLVNQSNNSNWLMEIDYAPLDRIDLYMLSDSSLTWIHKIGGDNFPITARDLQHRHPIFSITILPGESKTIFLRVQTISSVQMPISLWHRSAFQNATYTIQLINGFFYGGMILMMFYQLFIFISVRDKITFYYVLTLLTMVNVVAFFQGYTFLYLFPNNPWFNDILAMITGPAFVLCSTLLTRAFLNLRRVSQVLDNLLLGNMFIDLALVVLMILFFRKVSYQYHNYIIFMHCLLALICAGHCFYKKYKPARYYLLAWFTVFVAAGVFTISSVGFMPGYLGTNYTGLMVGCLLQTLFISFALGDRWSDLRKENQRGKELELKRGLQENERLEREVQLRVEEIQLKSEKLEEVNRVKDKLFSVVSHDIKGPLSSLQLALSLLKSGDVSKEEFQHLSLSLDTRFSQTTEFIENLLQWATLQLKGETFEPTYIDIAKLGEETVRLLQSDIVKKNIVINNNLHHSLQVYADLNMIRSVYRNLFTNAIKFTGVGGSITLNAFSANRQIIISVADTGVGIPADNRDHMFTLSSVTTPGTRQEKGTGLGLLLCKEFIEKNGGRIWFESEEGMGTTFFFSLPQSQEKQMVSA